MDLRQVRKAAREQGWSEEPTRHGILFVPPDKKKSLAAAGSRPLGVRVGKRWNVEITVRSAGKTEFEREAAERLLDALRDVDPAIALGPQEITMAFAVEADGPATAATRAVARASRACASARLGEIASRISRIHIETPEELARRVDETNLPRLMGVAEVARMLQVTKQRVSELRRAEWFPPPLVELAAGPVWTRDSIEEFHRRWERKPGRPRSSTSGRV